MSIFQIEYSSSRKTTTTARPTALHSSSMLSVSGTVYSTSPCRARSSAPKDRHMSSRCAALSSSVPSTWWSTMSSVVSVVCSAAAANGMAKRTRTHFWSAQALGHAITVCNTTLSNLQHRLSGTPLCVYNLCSYSRCVRQRHISIVRKFVRTRRQQHFDCVPCLVHLQWLIDQQMNCERLQFANWALCGGGHHIVVRRGHTTERSVR